MKPLGFISEHTPSKISKNFDEYTVNVSNPFKKEIINYLRKGKLIAVSMHIIESLISDEVIGGVIYRSDGEWIWAEYLSYYLEKINIEIPNEFILHVKKQKKSKQFNIDIAIDFLIEHNIS